MYYITASAPESIKVDRWSTTLACHTSLTGPFFIMVIILLLLPQIIGGFAYFTLYFREFVVFLYYNYVLTAPVAQSDRAFVFGTKGWGFEPLQVHYFLELNRIAL